MTLRVTDAMRVLVVNAGSSSLKLSVLDGDDVVAATDAGRSRRRSSRANDRIDAVGHRVVHGGTEFTAPVVIDDGVERQLLALTPLAPLHQPRAVQLIREARELLPDVPHVACFDTAFHATMPAAAKTYALPKEWRDHWPVQRFGFHGLSHAYASRTAAERLGRPLAELRMVTCHLGAGRVAVRGARRTSVDTTMGMTPLEGLVMATRAGSIDPGLVVWVQQYGGLSLGAVQHTLEEESGLKGLFGSGDIRDVIAARADGDDVGRARVRRLRPPTPARDRRDGARASVGSTSSCSPGEWASTHPKSATRRPHRSTVSRCSSSKPAKTSRSRAPSSGWRRPGEDARPCLRS